MEVSLSPALVELLHSLPAEAQTYNVYVVGGAVRDALMGIETKDFDLVIEGDAIEFAKRFFHGSLYRVYKKYMTATALLKNGIRVDFAASRRERYEYPGSMPLVAPAPIEDDLARRDFTVNAIAFGLFGRHKGRVIDPFSGIEDISARWIRVLHDGSFIDDPVRVIRAARYSFRFGFACEPRTDELMFQAGGLGVIRNVSKARRLDEILLIFKEPADVIHRIISFIEERLSWAAVLECEIQLMPQEPFLSQRDAYRWFYSQLSDRIRKDFGFKDIIEGEL